MRLRLETFVSVAFTWGGGVYVLNFELGMDV